MKYELVNNFLLKNDGTTIEDKIVEELNSKKEFNVEFDNGDVLTIEVGRSVLSSFNHITVSTSLGTENKSGVFKRKRIKEFFQLININKAILCFLEILHSNDITKPPKIKSQKLHEIQIKDFRNLFNLDSSFTYIELMLKRFLTKLHNEELYEKNKDAILLLHKIDSSSERIIRDNYPNIPYNRFLLLFIFSHIESNKEKKVEHFAFAADEYNNYCSTIREIEEQVLAEEFNVIV